MKNTIRLRSFLAIASSSLLAISSANAQTWANSNITATPAASLNWFNATQGAWTASTPVSSSTANIQFFQDVTTALLNEGASGDTQTSVIDTAGDAAFELGTLTLSGLASATTGANLTMNISGDALNFSAATGTINLNALNATRTITYNVNSNIQLGTTGSVGALTITGNGTNVFNIGGSISELQLGGGSLIKNGSSTVSLNNGNTYTGRTTITQGVLLLNHATALPGGIGSTGGTSNLTFNGAGTNITVLGLGIGNFSRPLGANTLTGAVTFTNNGGWAAYGADRTVTLGGAAITWADANTGFNAKTLILGAAGATHTVTLVNALDLGSATRTVITGDGSALVDGILSGNITSSGGGLTKTGSGNLALPGTNTYTGKTTVGGGFPNPGPLTFQGKQAVSPDTTFETRQNSGSTARLVFLDDTAGPISLNNSWTFVSENRQDTTANTHIFVGNNHTDNGGNNPGSTQTGSTIALGGYISAPSSAVAPSVETINITGANGYKLQLASIALPNLTSKSAATTFTMTMNPTTAPLIVAGGVTPFASTNANCTPIIALGGTATGNEIRGAIVNPSNAPVTSNPLSLTKSNTSTWTLTSTANTYTGVTTISGGILEVKKLDLGGNNSSIGASANVAGNLILNGGTLRYTGGAQSTDRLFSLQVSSSLDASGTGAVNFTNIGSMGFNGGTTAKTLTLTGTNTGNNTLAAAIGNNTGATSISKTGIGTWVLSGVNNATGTTSLSGGGTLVLDYTGGDTSRLPSGVLNLGAGNLTLKGGTASNTQAVASTTITPQSVNTGNTDISRDGGSSKIALGAITRSGTNGNGGTISIAADNLATTTSSNANGILSGAITIGSNYVKNDGAGNIVALSGISAGNYANFTALTNTATENYQLTGTLARGAAAINSLRIVSDGDDQFLDLGNNVSFQVGTSAAFNASGGILYAGGGNNNYTIKGTGTSTLQMQNGNQEVIINVYTGTLNVETRVGNGTGVFTKTGTGTLVLKGASIYTGRTHVNQGTLLVNNTTENGIGTGAVTVASGATLGGTGTVGGSTTLAAGGGLTFDLTTASGSHDKLELAETKTLTFTGTSTLTITSSGGTPGTGTYTLLTAPGGISGSVPAMVNLPGGWTAGAPQIVGNDLQINITSTGGGGSAYDTWKAANAPGSNPDDDTDGDGVPNAVEFVLGGTTPTNDLGKLPVVSDDGTNVVFTFFRAQSSIDPKTGLSIEVGTDLATWTAPFSPYAVPDIAAASNPGVTVEKNNPAAGTDKITLRVVKSPDPKKFARLKVVITP